MVGGRGNGGTGDGPDRRDERTDGRSRCHSRADGAVERDRRGATRSSVDRAQLLLVGSLAIAVLVVGLAVVFNSVILAGTPTAGGGVADADEAAQFDDEVRRDVRSLLIHTNHYRIYRTVDDLNESAADNVTTYGHLIGESHAYGSGTFANVTYVEPETVGTRVVQARDGNFTDDGTVTGDPTWEPVAERSRVGWLVLNLNASETPQETGSDRFHVRLRGDNGSVTDLYFARNVSSTRGVEALDVESDTPGVGSVAVTCRATDDRVLFDVLAGTTFGGNCNSSVPTVDPLDAPYRVEFRNGDAVSGKYSVVVDGSNDNGPHDDLNPLNGAIPGPPQEYNCDLAGPGDPCNAPALWRANVSTTYESGELAYDNSMSITVYNASR